ncbi:MAG: 2,3-bisphosphoglycerate-independent phosphoglycerate mutase [Bacillota bacterium]|nr:2,3-bisphosphoglycerate-independent phosphoglycerate mutase [Bacillota bacterium]
MKYILLIGDGMADNPVPELGNLTPLQYAKKPFIDSLAAKGEVGSVLNVPRGLPAGSDTAILSIFGCDPNKYFKGRAPLEAAAGGIVLNDGDIAYRCNMVTYEDSDLPFEEKRILSHSAGSIEGEESDEIVTALFGHPDFAPLAAAAGMKVNLGHSFRHIGQQSGADITGIKLIPPHDHLGEKIGPILPGGCPNAEVLLGLMKKAHEILNHHPLNEKRRAEGKMPANGIWFWAEGTAVKLPNFIENYGYDGAVISAVPLCHGIAVLCGLDMICPEGATGEIDTNYENKMLAAMDILEKHDFAAIHVEAPDECTHNGDLKGKIQAIEWLDTRMMKPLTEAMEEKGWDYRILFLSDHKTLTATRGHDGDPVPYMIYDSRFDSGAGYPYTEEGGMHGPTVNSGVALMSMLFEQL